MKTVSLFLDITKIADFRWKNAVISRTHGVGLVIYIFFGSFLGQVLLSEVSSL